MTPEERTKALFNRWSIVHFCSFLAITAWVVALARLPFLTTMLIALGVGILWEVIEYVWERQKGFEEKMGGGESWYGRWIGDIIVDLSGAAAGWYIAYSWLADQDVW